MYNLRYCSVDDFFEYVSDKKNTVSFQTIDSVCYCIRQFILSFFYDGGITSVRNISVVHGFGAPYQEFIEIVNGIPIKVYKKTF